MKLWIRKKETIQRQKLKNIIHAPSSESTRKYDERIMNSRRLNVYLGKRLNKLFEGKNHE